MGRWGKHQDFADQPELAFRKVGKKMTLEGGGGGGGPTTNTSYTSNLPEYAKPYFEDIMGRAQGASLTPYQTYGGNRVAGLSPYQQAAHQMTGQIAMGGTPAGIRAGQQMTTDAANRVAGYNYNPMAASYQSVAGPSLQNYQMGPVQQLFSPGVGRAGDVYAGQVSGPGSIAYDRISSGQLGPVQQLYSPGVNRAGDVYAGQVSGPGSIAYDRISSGQLGQQLSSADTGAVQRFSSPYIQSVVDVEKQAAVRDYQLADQVRQAKAAQAGAFGGSRQAVESAEAQRGLMSQLQGIQAKGTQAAYDQAQAALQAERASQMQAGQFNIQSALQAAQANQQIGSQMNVRSAELSQQAQQLNQQAALSAAQGNQQQANQIYARAAELEQQARVANQQAALTTGQQNLQALLSTQQLGTQTGMQAALANQQAFQDMQKQYEASRQFGATSGLQAAQHLGALGLQAGHLGEAEQKLALERAQALSGVGREQQTQQQQQLDQAYAEFAAQRDYEQNMINWYNSILRGVPVSMNQSVYQTTPAPSMASQLAGLGIAGLGAYNALK